MMAARMLGQFGQGELALYNNFIMLAVLLFSIGLPAAIVHFIASGKLLKEKLPSLLLAVIVLGCAGFALLAGFLSILSNKIHLLPDLFYLQPFWFFVAGIHLVCTIAIGFLQAILQAEAAFKKAAYLLVSGSLLLSLFYATYYFQWIVIAVEPLPFIMSSLLIVAGIQLIGYFVIVINLNRAYLKITRLQFSDIHPLLWFAFLAFATNLIQFLSYRMDIWFVRYFYGEAETGIYALGVSLAQMLWLLPSAVQSVIYTYISTHTNKKLSIEKTIATTKQLAWYAVLAGIFGGLISVYIVPYLFGFEFSESAKIIQVLLIGVIPFCLSMPVSAYFAATHKVQINLHSAIIGFAICLLGDILLIPSYGIKGAAFASVLSYLSTLGYLMIRFRLESKKST